MGINKWYIISKNAEEKKMAEKIKNHKKLMEKPLNKHYEEPSLTTAAEEDEYVSNGGPKTHSGKEIASKHRH